MKLSFPFFLLFFTELAISGPRTAGVLYPKEGGDGPAVMTWAREYHPQSLSPLSSESTYTDLLPYLVPSPDQLSAGSCLYMSHTGNLEWWWNRLHNQINPGNEGIGDFSERSVMNIAKSSAVSIGNPLTDTIYQLNAGKQSLRLNRDYRFTKGWYTTQNGSYEKSDSLAQNAKYSEKYNWISDLNSITSYTPIVMPDFDRELIFEDPDQNRWALNTMPVDIVDTIKKKLRERQAPVLVTYNHYLTWHAVLIVGFDDLASTEQCEFTEGFDDYMKERADEAIKEGSPAKAKKYLAQGKSVMDAQAREGGCSPHGVFLVRDSIYPDKAAGLYDYDPSKVGEEEPYSKKIIQREYQWLKRFGNHAIQIYPTN